MPGTVWYAFSFHGAPKIKAPKASSKNHSLASCIHHMVIHGFSRVTESNGHLSEDIDLLVDTVTVRRCLKLRGRRDLNIAACLDPSAAGCEAPHAECLPLF